MAPCRACCEVSFYGLSLAVLGFKAFAHLTAQGLAQHGAGQFVDLVVVLGYLVAGQALVAVLFELFGVDGVALGGDDCGGDLFAAGAIR